MVEHLAAQMQVMAKAGKLKPLEDWLAFVRPRKKRTAADWIQTMKDAAARGAPITITKKET